MIANLQCIFNYLSFLEKVTLLFMTFPQGLKTYSFLWDFHDGLCKEMSKMKGQTSLAVVHSYPSFVGKRPLKYQIQWCVNYNQWGTESCKKLRSFLLAGNGNPFQYSCLENPMDGGAWCRLLSMESQRVGHNWATSFSIDRPPWVLGLNVVPSDHEKGRLDIMGLGLFLGGELTGYWGLTIWEKLYQGNAGHFLP